MDPEQELEPGPGLDPVLALHLVHPLHHQVLVLERVLRLVRMPGHMPALELGPEEDVEAEEVVVVAAAVEEVAPDMVMVRAPDMVMEKVVVTKIIR